MIIIFNCDQLFSRYFLLPTRPVGGITCTPSNNKYERNNRAFSTGINVAGKHVSCIIDETFVNDESFKFNGYVRC